MGKCFIYKTTFLFTDEEPLVEFKNGSWINITNKGE